MFLEFFQSHCQRRMKGGVSPLKSCCSLCVSMLLSHSPSLLLQLLSEHLFNCWSLLGHTKLSKTRFLLQVCGPEHFGVFQSLISLLGFLGLREGMC
jgi:hypothetical protein